MLLWFLLRAEPRFKGIEDAIDRQSRAVLLLIVSIPQIPNYLKEQAQGIVREIDEKNK